MQYNSLSSIVINTGSKHFVKSIVNYNVNSSLHHSLQCLILISFITHFGASLGGTVPGDPSFLIFAINPDLACLLLSLSSRIFITSIRPTAT